ncbi:MULTISPECIES: CoA-disulfide reductase [Bacillus]|uniref:CoA-disulfide reductase n=1 Tax=Bacillus pseudomycoides TaxID=64104 RepID=A0A1Y3MH11_9BACI|nr:MULTISPECIES: CoA-disulfide reductase [Bacillus cereus group]EOP60706.1 CoA-disulfide reductase [Bacillus cereus VD136]EOP75968.1 CoA-disulfide reductase [Bacillus cereus VDM006]EOQ15496.1 CoA-disulfide reductase [Bacillus cereus VDM021]OOG90498.1 CoA-disulfide reductase [Bacillus mycoides]OUM49104.1 CoA-disulfide reductase [Bacillus pseudomycoides]
MSKKIVVVGGVAGGASVAARLRRLSEEDEIIMFERGEYISFANCGLPYYIGGVIQERQKLLVQTVEKMSKRFHLDIRVLSEVIKINKEEKTIIVKNVMTNETYEESYDILILSPGSKPIVPPIPGIETAKALFTLRNVPDTDRIKGYIDEQKPRHATVIGGGFIGVEMAENLREKGIDVTLVEMANQVMPPIDYEMAAYVHEHMKKHGVQLILEDGVDVFEEGGAVVRLKSGSKINTDMVILSIGVQPESSLAKEAGLELGVRGTIKVNEKLQTSDSSIYAIGDAIEVKDFVTETETMIPLAWPANRQGRLLADIIHGHTESVYKGTMGTSIAKVFELTVASTGVNEKVLQRLNIPYEVVHVQANSHAGYYPNAYPILLKLLFNKESGEIYGAQAVGRDGVDKRIDVIATAMKAKLKVMDLPDLELAYAPPYSSAKDPVNMVGYAASNMIEGLVDTVQWHEINHIAPKGGYLMDVREPNELKQGMIKGSVNIPLDELRERLDEIPVNEEIYITCQLGMRGYVAARMLMEKGYKVKNVDGGFKLYATALPDRIVYK